ncbi:MAG: response regulator, partial [Desulfobacterales bacterium]|nr:response regulator [Desulfobacterales bacterium]
MTKKSAYKIMVVEDEAVIALNLQQMLTKMGYDVIGVSYSGEEALEKARSLRPDLILMDIMMPGKLDGIAAAKIIKAELGIPVVFLTAYSEDKIIESAKQTEPYGYILKPSQDREIKATVKIALYKKEMEKALQDSESKLSAMLASVGDHMSMMDKDLNIIWANEIAEKIFGNDIIGKKCYEVYHKRTEPCEPYPCITVRAFQDGTIHEHDTQVIDKDGKTIFF